MPPPPNTRPILLLAALLLATASSTAAMQLFPMASHPEVDACVDAEADERRLLQHDHRDRGGVSTCGVDDPVTTRHPAVRARWPAVVDALRRSVRDTTARAREGLRRARLRHRAAARASSEETPADGDDGDAADDDDDEGAHHAAQRDTLAAIVDTLEDIERQCSSRRCRASRRRERLRPRGAPRPRAVGPAAARRNARHPRWCHDEPRPRRLAARLAVQDRRRRGGDGPRVRAARGRARARDENLAVDHDARTLGVFGRRDDAEDTNANAKTKPKTKNAAAADDEDRSEHPASGPALATPVYHARERHFGAFENTYALPPDADALAVVAAVRGGVLEVTVPKRLAEAGTEPRGPRRVAVARE